MRIQEKLGAHPGKTARRVGKITRREVFSKVKDVNVESRKKRSKLLVFRRNSSTFLSMNAHEWAHQIGVHFRTRITQMGERQRDKETKSQRDKEMKRQRVKKMKRLREEEIKSRREEETNYYVCNEKPLTMA